MPHYLRIGYIFKLGKTKWRGAVIASPEALFMYMQLKQSTALLVAHFGAFGALAAAGAAKLAKPSQARTCDISELDAGIRDHPDWPLKKVVKGDLVVIPRAAVAVLKHPGWTNLIKFEANGEPCSIEYALFGGNKARQFL